MYLERKMFWLSSLIVLSGIVFISGCLPESFLDFDLSEEIEEFYSNFTADERVFIDSILSSDDPAFKGSFEWIENEIFEGELRKEKNIEIIDKTAMILFLYPPEHMPEDQDEGMIFSVIDQESTANSDNEHVVWYSFARLPDDNIKSVKVKCRYMLRLATDQKDSENEKLVDIFVEYELKNGKWILAKDKISKYTRKP